MKTKKQKEEKRSDFDVSILRDIDYDHNLLNQEMRLKYKIHETIIDFFKKEFEGCHDEDEIIDPDLDISIEVLMSLVKKYQNNKFEDKGFDEYLKFLKEKNDSRKV